MADSSNTREEYMRERQRIRNFIRRAEKRGYTFNENPGDETIPKNPTESDVERLKEYTPDRLYSQATATQIIYDRNGQATEKTISGTDARKLERQEAGRRGYQAHVEAEEEGYSSVADYRESQTLSRMEEPETSTDTSNASRYAEIAAKQSMPRETIQSMGFDNIEEMLDDPIGTRFVNYWYENVYPNMDVAGTKDIDTAPIQGYTQSDLDSADARAESDAYDYDNYGRVEESRLIFNSLNDKFDAFSGVGSDNLRRVLGLQIHYYGEQKVAEFLSKLEEENPNLMEQLDELINYRDFGYSAADASRAYRAISDAITSFGENTFSSKDLGNVLDAMEVFDVVE